VKKILLFFIFISLFACETIQNKDNNISKIGCPATFFSSENNVYSDGDTKSLDFEKINYKASLNNYGFAGNCLADLENNYYFLDLLILVEPINPQNQKIDLPIFVILYDEKENIIDRQYFRVTENINYDKKISNYITTDIISRLDILVENNIKVSSLTIGFVNIDK